MRANLRRPYDPPPPCQGSGHTHGRAPFTPDTRHPSPPWLLLGGRHSELASRLEADASGYPFWRDRTTAIGSLRTPVTVAGAPSGERSPITRMRRKHSRRSPAAVRGRVGARACGRVESRPAQGVCGLWFSCRCSGCVPAVLFCWGRTWFVSAGEVAKRGRQFFAS